MRARVTAVGLALLGALWLWLPSPIDSVPFPPPRSPQLALPENTRLRGAEVLPLAGIVGPEDIAIRADGSLLVGVEDGRILSVTWAAPPRIELFAHTGGRPLGLWLEGDRLWVADGTKGLLVVEKDGRVASVVESVDGHPLRFTNSVVVASDGMVYFTDSSAKYGPKEYLYELFEARPTGRLLRYDPRARATRTLLSSLFFANGVALSRKEDFLLVNETYAYRVVRYWLKGPRAGSAEVILENLPGFPDGLSRGREHFWLALFTVRNSFMDWLHGFPFLKNQLAKLPPLFWPKPAPHGYFLRFDEAGRPIASYQDPGGERVREVTIARERGGFVYFGTLHGEWVGRLPFDEPAK